jgi:hypothetical protein
MPTRARSTRIGTGTALAPGDAVGPVDGTVDGVADGDGEAGAALGDGDDTSGGIGGGGGGGGNPCARATTGISVASDTSAAASRIVETGHRAC